MAAYTLSNRSGDSLTVLAQGASLQRWLVRLGNSQRELILGYPNAQHYLQDSCYMGAVVGPYANRIAGGTLRLGQQHYQLQQNEGRHHLHGGSIGLHRLQWQCVLQQASRLVLSCTVADGHAGYPGPLQFTITYQLNDDSSLDVTLVAQAAQLTLAAPTLHPYFNLAAQQQAIDQHQLWLAATHYTPTDSEKIPTGELHPVVGTALDFRQARAIGTVQLDHNYAVSAGVVSLRLEKPSAILTSPDQQLRLLVSSDFPGLQLYSGDYLAAPFTPRQGICLEPQFYPDSPNHSQFPLRLTTPQQPFVAHIRYQVEKG